MTKITPCFDTVGGFYRFLTQYLTAHRDESEYVHVFFGLFVCFPKFFLFVFSAYQRRDAPGVCLGSPSARPAAPV